MRSYHFVNRKRYSSVTINYKQNFKLKRKKNAQLLLNWISCRFVDLLLKSILFQSQSLPMKIFRNKKLFSFVCFSALSFIRTYLVYFIFLWFVHISMENLKIKKANDKNNSFIKVGYWNDCRSQNFVIFFLIHRS